MILSSASHPSFLMMLEDIDSNNTTALNPERDKKCRFDVISRAPISLLHFRSRACGRVWQNWEEHDKNMAELTRWMSNSTFKLNISNLVTTVSAKGFSFKLDLGVVKEAS